jgi:hypothetical protein
MKTDSLVGLLISHNNTAIQDTAQAAVDACLKADPDLNNKSMKEVMYKYFTTMKECNTALGEVVSTHMLQEHNK